MEFNPFNLLAQIPLVGIFVWFVLKRDKYWQEYLRERNGREEKALAAIATRLEQMGDKLEKHTEAVLKRK